MRIAMLGCKGLPAATALGGGVEMHVEELATRLAARGHDVVVYVRPYANPQRLTMWRGVRLVTLPTIQTKHFDAIVSTLLATLHAIFQAYDIIHYHGVGPSTMAWLPRLFKPRAKVVVTFHSQDRFHEKWGWFARTYLTLGEFTAVAFPHITIAVSHTIERFCQRKFGTAVKYIPNGVKAVETRPGNAALQQFGVAPKQYFFTLSRFVPHKAVEDVIQAFAGVKTDMKLLIIGWAAPSEAAYVAALKRLAAQVPRVVLAGRQTGRSLDQLIANGYAMLHASRSEGLSVSILEAMARGKCVLASDIPENLELMQAAGTSFRVGDIPDLRQKIQWLIDHPRLVAACGQQARELVKRSYSWDSIVRATEEVYASLVRH